MKTVFGGYCDFVLSGSGFLSEYQEDARDDKVWAIVTGEYDEQYVVRYRLEELTEHM